jgi:hypothetical protein
MKNYNINYIYMSLQQLLQGYAQDISAKEEHANAIADDNRDRKALDYNEQLQNHLDALTSGATELGTASSAIHMGRKIYKRYKEGRATYKKVEDLVNKVKKAASGGDAPTGEEGDAVREGAEPTRPLGQQAGGGQRDAPDGGEGQEAQTKTTTQDSGSGAGDGVKPVGDETLQSVSEDSKIVNQRFKQLPEESQQTLEQQFKSNPLRVENPQSPEEFRQNLNLRSQAVEQEQQRLGSRPAQPQAEGQEVTPGSQPATEPQPAPESSEQNLLSRRTTTIADAPESELTSQPFSEPKTLGRTIVKNPSLEGGAPDAPTGATSSLERTGAELQDTVNGVKSRVGNFTDNLASKALNSVKSSLPESIGDFLGSGAGEIMSGALDAIPVVGEVASVVTGLVSLFEGLNKKKQEDQQADKDITGNISGVAQTAIDPSALTKAAPTVGATLV